MKRFLELARTLFRRSIGKSIPGKAVPLWESVEVSKNVFVEKIPPELLEQWKAERRERDNLHLLRRTDGFHFVSQGRCGTIYFVDSGKVCEIAWEMSGVPHLDLLIFEETMTKRHFPQDVEMSPEETSSLRLALKAWLAGKNMKADIFEESRDS